MVAICPADLDTVGQTWDLFVWLCLGLTMHSAFRLIYKSVKRDDYSAVSAVAMFMPNEQLYHLVTFSMMMAGCYANWRVYTCEDWDGHAVGHALFFFWTLTLGMTHLGWINYGMTIFGGIMFFVSMMLSICNIIFAWKFDYFAVIAHFILCFLCGGLGIVHFYLYANRKEYAAKVVAYNEVWDRSKIRRLERDSAAALEQRSVSADGSVVDEEAPETETTTTTTTTGSAPVTSEMRQRSVVDSGMFSKFH